MHRGRLLPSGPVEGPLETITIKLPLFPLPGVVLLPGTTLSLHIFEPRYRAMVADALEGGSRTIGMAMMKPGWERLGPSPPIFPVGGAGRIVEAEQLPDGRYNIVLAGEFRYRVVEESPPAPYRMANVERLASTPFPTSTRAAAVCAEAAGLFLELAGTMELPSLPDEAFDPERLASELALRLRYEPAELQAFLEKDSLPDRFSLLLARMREWRERVRFLAPFRSGQPGPDSNRN